DATLLPAIMGLGWMCMELGQNAEAVEVFESLIKRGMSALPVLFALTGMPSAYINIDLLAELDKLPRDQAEGQRESEQLAAFVRIKALDKVGRHDRRPHRSSTYRGGPVRLIDN